ncbi:hypothetical protein [Blastomonas sp.]|uniref:hypothetical protein n=1 Tax=Blastomonas sp. TaxID=1909299 RepID=UPI0026126475|nr:hypothetical protein [Blastomonas sp.]MDM7956344.1 hypothetical protein [Blastomonas sp.]
MVIAVVALLAVPAAAGAQPTAEEATDPFRDGIEVLGQREVAKKVLKDNLRELMAPIPLFDVIPKFFQPLCLQVVGMAPDASAIVSDRINRTALDVGLDPAKPNCRANALVVVVDDPRALFEKMLTRRRGIVGIAEMRDVQTRQLRDELRARKPAVAWNLSNLANSNGATQDGEGFVIATSISASRLTSNFYRPKSLSVVLFDSTRIKDVTLDQLADYAALHLLGSPRRQIDFDSVAVPSLLSLFAQGPEAAPSELTQFDRAYLKGLYTLEAGALRSRVPGAVLAGFAQQCEDQQDSCRMQLKK